MRTPLRSWSPRWANLQVYWDRALDTWRAERGRDKLLLWFKPPGWRPADLRRHFPKPAFVSLGLMGRLGSGSAAPRAPSPSSPTAP